MSIPSFESCKLSLPFFVHSLFDDKGNPLPVEKQEIESLPLYDVKLLASIKTDLNKEIKEQIEKTKCLTSVSPGAKVYFAPGSTFARFKFSAWAKKNNVKKVLDPKKADVIVIDDLEALYLDEHSKYNKFVFPRYYKLDTYASYAQPLYLHGYLNGDDENLVILDKSNSLLTTHYNNLKALRTTKEKIDYILDKKLVFRNILLDSELQWSSTRLNFKGVLEGTFFDYKNSTNQHFYKILDHLTYLRKLHESNLYGKFILSGILGHITSEDYTVIDKTYFEKLDRMFNSPDQATVKLAGELLASCKVDTNLFYAAYLTSKYQNKLGSYKTSVSFNTFLKRLDYELYKAGQLSLTHFNSPNNLMRIYVNDTLPLSSDEYDSLKYTLEKYIKDYVSSNFLGYNGHECIEIKVGDVKHPEPTAPELPKFPDEPELDELSNNEQATVEGIPS